MILECDVSLFRHKNDLMVFLDKRFTFDKNSLRMNDDDHLGQGKNADKQEKELKYVVIATIVCAIIGGILSCFF